VAAGGASETPLSAPDQPQADAGTGAAPVPDDAETAVFAGGCFWCMEEAYEQVPGVLDAVSGYAGGDVPNPGYRQVVAGSTGHYEVVRVYYDPRTVSYEDLLHVFWRNVDPLDDGGQFCDRGTSYLTGIFYETEEQRRLAEESRAELEQSGRFSREIVTEIMPLDVIPDDDNDGFWEAEDYHQGYYITNAARYRFYKESCGRVRRLEQLWGAEAGAPSFTESDA
ncbi:MAG TPA: peptide-methionine (S)-S-oxide reductase MsrA, partial [Spirochaetia bacterium]|nr:peptide-methionine (S)-S-oxide reductase MsrA [Spirochaetia bacterium]